MNDVPDSSQSSRFEQVLAEYLRDVDNGVSVDRRQLLEKHPDLAAEFESFFRNRDAIERLAAPLMNQPDETVILSGRSSAQEGPPAAGEHVKYFGDYQLLEEIGRGAMGVVYRAEQCSLHRPVAIKMILRGALATAEDVERFHREAEAAANLDHPQIVSIFEVGEHDGTHYFAMQLVEGSNLAGLLPKLSNDMCRCVELLTSVARAVHHAHQRGVLHRDVKPANILIDQQGCPYLTDFGLAKRVDQAATLTQTGAIVGTPAYMAPEQAGAEKQLTTAVDVYSLGAILYEVLTGHPPFHAETPLQTLLHVMTQEPRAPSGIRWCDRDLETICLKCLNKDPGRRYDSAAALADDLERWLRGEAVTARRISSSERIFKWSRRNRMLASLMTATMVLLVALLGLSWWSYFSIQAEADDARQAEASAIEQLYSATILLAQSAMDRNMSGQARLALERAPSALRGWEHRYLSQAADSSLTTLPLHDFGMDLRFTPTNDQLFYAGAQECQWLNLRLGREASESMNSSKGYGRALGEAAPNVAVNRSATLAAIDNQDGTHLWHFSNPPVTLTAPVQPRADDPSPSAPVMTALAISTNEERLYRAGHGVLACWSVADRQLLWTLEIPGKHCWGLAVSPNEDFAAMELEDNSIQLVDLESRELAAVAPPLRNTPARMQFSSDGRHLVAHCDFDLPRVYAIPSLDLTATVNINGAWITVLSSDTRLAATGTQFGEVVLWETASGRVMTWLRGHREWVHALAFSPDDQWLASGGRDRTVLLWRVEREAGRVFGQLDQRLVGHQDTVLGLAFDTKGERLASGSSASDGVRLWDLSRASNPFRVPVARGQVRDIQWFPDERRAAIAGFFRQGQQLEGRVELWDFGSGRRLVTLGPQAAEIGAVAVSPDSTQVACASDDGAVVVWDPQSGQRLRTIREPVVAQPEAEKRSPDTRMTAAAWSPDGATLMVGGGQGEIFALDAITGRELWRQQRTSAPSHGSEQLPLTVRAVRFDATGQRVLVFGVLGSFQAWVSVHRLVDGSAVYESQPVSAECGWACSPDRRRIAVCNDEELVEILLGESPSTRILWNQCNSPGTIAYSPDGRWLALGQSTHEILLFRYQETNGVDPEPIVLTGHLSKITSLAFLKDSSRLISGSWDNTVKVWAPEMGAELLSLRFSENSDDRVEHVFAVGQVILGTNGFPIDGLGDFHRVVAWNASGFRDPPVTANASAQHEH